MLFIVNTKKLLVLLVILLVLFQKTQAASPDDIWHNYNAKKTNSINSLEYDQIVIFNKAAFLKKTKNIVVEKSHEVLKANREVYLPTPEGKYELFKIIESSIMEPELAKRYSDIKTYRGVGVDDPYASLRMDVSSIGCHVQVRSPGRNYYIDPFNDNKKHIVRKRSKFEPKSDFVCLNNSNTGKVKTSKSDRQNLGLKFTKSSLKNNIGSELNIFRIAVAATGEYTTYHGGKSNAVNAIVIAINRVNQIYENDLAIRLILVADNDKIVYSDSNTDPYSDFNAGALLEQNQDNIDAVIGVDNYDIGHVFGTQAQGLAGLGVVCSEGKAAGTTGVLEPDGDPFWVDYVAHEIGHQFGAEHTFNGNENACFGNIATSSSYEPGSGSTIMGYAGICADDNLQSNTDPFFHAISILEIYTYLELFSCVNTSNIGNTPPVAEAGPDYVIPNNTPFTLTGHAIDPDDNSLTYSWEEWDLGPSQSIYEMNDLDNGYSPRFRCWPPTNSPVRVFPRLSDLLNNTTSVGEKLPEINRYLRFKLVVRDNNSGGGGVDTDDMVIQVVSNSQPFRVTNPNAQQVIFDQMFTIQWDVAGTFEPPVNCSEVNILLSLDGGYTWPYTLASATPNDGSEFIIFPAVNSTNARIKVEGFNNIFFDVSDESSIIDLTPEEAGILTFSTNKSYIYEQDEFINVEVVRLSKTNDSVSVRYDTIEGTAKAYLDYFPISDTLDFNSGQISKTIMLGISDDTLSSSDLYFDIILSQPDFGVVLGEYTKHRVYIRNDDEKNTRTIKKCNNNPITIEVFGAATPYPSTITVTGLVGVIDNMTVELNGFGHNTPGDVDIMLAGPEGRSLFLMSDIGQGGGGAVTNLNLIFSDSASSSLHPEDLPESGTWKPTDYTVNLDDFPAPAPIPNIYDLSVFNGLSPNGEWQLYVVDDFPVEDGEITLGWCINFDLHNFMKIKSIDNSNDNIDVVVESSRSGTYGFLKITNLVEGTWVTNQEFNVSFKGNNTLSITNGVEETSVFYKVNYNSTLD